MPPDNSLPMYVQILDLILSGFLMASRNKATVNMTIPKYRLVLLTFRHVLLCISALTNTQHITHYYTDMLILRCQMC